MIARASAPRSSPTAGSGRSLLLLQRMRRMIGAQHVDDPLINAAPDAVAMAGVAHRRIHLRRSAEPLIAFRRGHGEMVRRRLARRHVLVVAQEARGERRNAARALLSACGRLTFRSYPVLRFRQRPLAG